MTLFHIEASLSTLRSLSLLSQSYHINKTSSIYSFSIDYLVLSTTESLYSLTATIFYQYSTVVQSQYQSRYPIYPTLNISSFITLTDVINLSICSLLLYQYLKYRNTRHKHQQLTKITISLLIFTLISLIFVQSHASTTTSTTTGPGRYGLFLIDAPNLLWVYSSIFGAFKYLPQCSLNFISVFSTHSNRHLLVFDNLRCLTFLCCGLYEGTEAFHWKFLNLQSDIANGVQCLFLILLTYQHHWVYRNAAKRWPSVMTALKDLDGGGSSSCVDDIERRAID